MRTQEPFLYEQNTKTQLITLCVSKSTNKKLTKACKLNSPNQTSLNEYFSLHRCNFGIFVCKQRFFPYNYFSVTEQLDSVFALLMDF